MAPMMDSREIEKIVLAYMLKARQLEEETVDVLRGNMGNLVTRVLLKINQNLKQLDQFKRYDGLYYHTESLREAFDGFLQALDTGIDTIGDAHVRELFAGVRAMVLEALAALPEKSDNPMTYERMVIISGGILRMKQHFMTALEGFDGTCTMGEDISGAHLLACLRNRATEFFEKEMPTVQAIGEETLDFLNGFEEGRKYEAFVREQKSTLYRYVLKQKTAIDNALTDEGEKATALALLDMLALCHSKSETVLSELEGADKGMASPEDIVNMAMVTALIESNLCTDNADCHGLLTRADTLGDESVHALKMLIARELTERNTEIQQQIQEASAVIQAMSHQLFQLFREAAQTTEGLIADFDTEQGLAISKGIGETMTLKAESMEEKDEAYQQGVKEGLDELEALLSEHKERVTDTSEDLLLKIVHGDMQPLERMQDAYSTYGGQVKKARFDYDMAYLRNDLFLELRTYEELVEHSMKKLIELEPERSGRLTEVMTQTLEKSREILNSHKIEVIRPSAHDRFDGRLHEVLMAEVAADFAKGEVIRTASTGYRLKDQVIMRAGVIAAR